MTTIDLESHAELRLLAGSLKSDDAAHAARAMLLGCVLASFDDRMIGVARESGLVVVPVP